MSHEGQLTNFIAKWRKANKMGLEQDAAVKKAKQLPPKPEGKHFKDDDLTTEP